MFKKKLTSIVSSFSKTLSQLESLQSQNSAAVEAKQKTVKKLNEESTILATESAQAQRIADKLRSILE